MQELKPCPFCGGEARIIAKPYEPKVCVGCDDDTCLGFSGLGWLYDSEKEATEAWNRRAERTCRVVPMDMAGNPPYRKGNWVFNALCDGCSECGFPFDTMNRGVPNYCPNCGARVVER